MTPTSRNRPPSQSTETIRRLPRRRLTDRLEAFGQMLIDARQLNGWSQRELGLRLKISQQDISRYERSGYRHASLRRLDRIARALGLTVTVEVRR